jgi:hypothetical protein
MGMVDVHQGVFGWLEYKGSHADLKLSKRTPSAE